jgi:hypothetical protein
VVLVLSSSFILYDFRIGAHFLITVRVSYCGQNLKILESSCFFDLCAFVP